MAITDLFNIGTIGELIAQFDDTPIVAARSHRILLGRVEADLLASVRAGDEIYIESAD